MEQIAKEIKALAEFGQLHNEDCCVHFPEDSRACDTDTGELDCCENMRILKTYAENLVRMVINFASYDIFVDNEEQRKAGVELYLGSLKENLK
jgi:hypothetical protein